MTAYSLRPGDIDTNLDAKIPLFGLLKIFYKIKTTGERAAITVYGALKSGLENETGRYLFFQPSLISPIVGLMTI